MFYAPTFMSLFAQSILFNGGNPEAAYTVNVTNATTLSNAFQAAGISLATAPLNNLPVFTPAQAAASLPVSSNNVIYMDPNFRNPKASQLQAGMERELGRGMPLSTSFSYINTVNIARQRDTNLGAPVTNATGRQIFSGVRPRAGFGVGQVTASEARELYRGLTTAFTLRRSRYNFNAYHTFSHNYSRGVRAVSTTTAKKASSPLATTNSPSARDVSFSPMHTACLANWSEVSGST